MIVCSRCKASKVQLPQQPMGGKLGPRLFSGSLLVPVGDVLAAARSSDETDPTIVSQVVPGPVYQHQHPVTEADEPYQVHWQVGRSDQHYDALASHLAGAAPSVPGFQFALDHYATAQFL